MKTTIGLMAVILAVSLQSMANEEFPETSCKNKYGQDAHPILVHIYKKQSCLRCLPETQEKDVYLNISFPYGPRGTDVTQKYLLNEGVFKKLGKPNMESWSKWFPETISLAYTPYELIWIDFKNHHYRLICE